MQHSNHENKAHQHFHNHSIVKNMWVAFALNFCFTIIEFVGGVIFNSTAILADAVHDLGDTIALASTLFLEKKSLKPEDKQYSFGYRRLSVLSGLLNGVVLIAGSIIMAVKSIEKIGAPGDVNSLGMIGLAILGIVFNGLAIFSMKKDHANINSKALSLHFLEDVLGWVIVLIGAIAIKLFNLPIIDPILSLLLSIFIAFNAFKLLIPVYYILMESVPKNLDLEKFTHALLEIKEVKNVHDLHVWSLDGNYHLMSAHFTVSSKLTKQDVIELRITTDEICKIFDIYHNTIEIEFQEN